MKYKLIILTGLALLSLIVNANQLKLSPIFSDNMVVQRNAPVKIYGKGCPNKTVTVEHYAKSYQVQVAQDSSWAIGLSAFALKEKHQLTVISEKDTICLKDIVAGDVWLCSGQSNMEFQVAQFKWCDTEVAAANDADIRFYSVPNTIDLIPMNDLPTGGSWKTATGNDLKQCSATAYFFAKNLRKSVDVPIGLICSDWSGTGLEPWMSLNAIAAYPQFKKEYAEFTANQKSSQQVESEFAQLRKTWDNEHYLTGKGITEQWYLPTTDFSEWKPYKPSEGYWEKQNLGLDNFDGTVWFQTTFDLPEDFKGDKFHLFLSYIKDYNTTWVNGHKVGETFGDKNWSDYYIADSILKPKNNVLVVRVMNIEGNGGFNFHPFWATPILNGQWYCKADQALPKDFVVPHIVNVNPFSHPNVLYNAMINPIAKNTAIKGVIWYQGESNAGRAYEYRSLFPAMITDWRKQFDEPQLPFYFVQLANFDKVDPSGNNNDWAELREAQQTATALPHVKMASAIDLGEEGGIHPQNKQDVGTRLAYAALADCYQLADEKKYPQIANVTFAQNKAKITLDQAIVIKGKTPISGFAIAGADQKFYPAKASINKGVITVYANEVTQPVALRYAWAKNPGTLNLFGKNGLPLLPYRSDKWKGITDDRVYDPEIVYF